MTSVRTRSRSRSRGSPNPPPPPVRMRTRSPALSISVSLSATCVVPSARSISTWPGCAVAAAVHAPRRRKRALEPGRDAARRQHQVAPFEPKPAAELAGPAGIGAQPEALDHERVARFVHLDRDQPGVAVALGAERARPIHVGERAPAAEAAVVALPEQAGVGMAARVGERAERAVVRRRDPVGNRRAERTDDEIDQHRQRRIVGAHRRRSAPR